MSCGRTRAGGTKRNRLSSRSYSRIRCKRLAPSLESDQPSWPETWLSWLSFVTDSANPPFTPEKALSKHGEKQNDILEGPMRLPPFQYIEPANVEEALSIISTHRETVKIMAGGTDLVNRMRLRLLEPAFVMNIGKLRNMDGIDTGDTETIMGANTRLREIAGAPLVNKRFRAIAEAAFQVASPAITNMATAGGNILQNTRCIDYNKSGMVLNGLERCHKRGGNVCLAVKGSKRCFSVYQGDMAPALIAFDARCVLEKKGSTRTVSLTELFTGNGAAPLAIGADELLTKIILPNPGASTAPLTGSYDSEEARTIRWHPLRHSSLSRRIGRSPDAVLSLAPLGVLRR